MRFHDLLIIIFLFGFSACRQPQASLPAKAEVLTAGRWRMVLDLDTTAARLELPFQFDLEKGAPGWRITIHNQDEAISVDSIAVKGDSIRVRMPFFDSEFLGTIQDPGHFSGLWYNHYKGPGYAIPFTAVLGDKPRFSQPASPASTGIAGDWEVHFLDGSESEPAIGIFTVDNGHVKGSFATETGDLRFLEGITTRDSLFLSSFNGSQAFLFRAAIRNDSLLGEFRSGHRWKQRWYGVRNPSFALANDETLTRLDTTKPVAFTFPDTDGNLHSLADVKYHGKPVVVEIMGTWCPNCMDQSRMLGELYNKYHKDGLEAVALSFERYPDTAQALEAIRHFKQRLGISYDLLYAGLAKSDSVERKLPFISKLKSYPTTLLIGRDGTVRHIYTGIYGPGTGARYVRFKERLENAIVEMLREPANR